MRCNKGIEMDLLFLIVFGSLTLMTAGNVRAAGVTVITHGFRSSIDPWIIPIFQQLTNVASLAGTKYTCYEFHFEQVQNGNYFLRPKLLAGNPLADDSGEIFIKLDWQPLAGTSTRVPRTTGRKGQ